MSYYASIYTNVEQDPLTLREEAGSQQPACELVLLVARAMMLHDALLFFLVLAPHIAGVSKYKIRRHSGMFYCIIQDLTRSDWDLGVLDDHSYCPSSTVRFAQVLERLASSRFRLARQPNRCVQVLDLT